MSNCNETWKCKCGCISKYSHKARWAFISKYKCNYLSKYKKINLNNLGDESSLINKLKIKKSTNNQEQFIPVKKVKYDENTCQMVVEIEKSELSNQIAQSKQKKTKRLKKIIRQKDLVELRELLGYIIK